MDPSAISVVVFVCILAGTILGRILRGLLPEKHLSESRDVIKLAVGLIGTMTALLLGLLIASAKSSFDTQRNGLSQLSANIIWLDRILAHYGTAAKDVRSKLKDAVTDLIQRTWSEEKSLAAPIDAKAGTEGRYEELYDRLQELAPKTDAQRTYKTQALRTAAEIGQSRWQMFAQKDNAIPTPLLVVMVLWLTLIHISFSLLAPRNVTSLATLLVCIFAVSSAVFMILELDQPFQGVFQISSDPLRNALAQLGR